MILAAHQPQFMPWLGYFDKMRSCDLFVIFDSVQYKKNEWQNRNRIWTPQGPQWLTVPVIHHFGDLINTLPVNNTVGWKDKHLKAIKQNYGKAPYFSAFLPDIEKLYAREYKTLSEVNIASVAMLAARLAVKTKTVLLSENEVDGAATLRLVNICKKFGADTYLAGAGGKDYMEMDLFEKAGIKVLFQEYRHPQYRHFGETFTPYLTAADLIFQEGENAAKIF